MSEAAAMFWYDLETTGTEKQYDEIIEIGVILTDFELNPLAKGENWIIEPSEYALGRLMKNEVVRNMHLQNSLLEDILNPDKTLDLGETIADVNSYINKLVGDGKMVMPCGSGIGHFDNKLMAEHMPEVFKRFTRQYVDIGVVRRFIKICGVAEPSTVKGDPKNHRALDDALLHLQEARTFRDRFQRFLQVPSVSILPCDAPEDPILAPPVYQPGGVVTTSKTVTARPIKAWNDGK